MFFSKITRARARRAAGQVLTFRGLFALHWAGVQARVAKEGEIIGPVRPAAGEIGEGDRGRRLRDPLTLGGEAVSAGKLADSKGGARC